MYTCQYKPYYTKEIKDEISGKTFKRCYYSIKDLREACHGAMGNVSEILCNLCRLAMIRNKKKCLPEQTDWAVEIQPVNQKPIETILPLKESKNTEEITFNDLQESNESTEYLVKNKKEGMIESEMKQLKDIKQWKKDFKALNEKINFLENQMTKERIQSQEKLEKIQKENKAKDSKIQLQDEKISILEKKVKIHLSCNKIELKNQNIEDLKKDINERIQSQKISNADAKLVRQLLASKICFSTYEDIETLLKLDGKSLFSKYENVMSVKDSEKRKLIEDANENLEDVKNKLKIKNGKLELHEKIHSEIMDLLKIPEKNRTISQILPKLKEVIDSYNDIHDDIEAGLFSNAEAAYEAYSKSMKK